MPEGTPGLPINQSTDLDERLHTQKMERFADFAKSFLGIRQRNSIRFATSLVGSNNPWWLDLPIEWVPALLQAVETATVRNGNLRFIDGVKGWIADEMDELRPEVESALDYDSIPGPSIPVEDGIFSETLPHGWVLESMGRQG